MGLCSQRSGHGARHQEALPNGGSRRRTEGDSCVSGKARRLHGRVLGTRPRPSDSESTNSSLCGRDPEWGAPRPGLIRPPQLPPLPPGEAQAPGGRERGGAHSPAARPVPKKP